MMPKFARNLLLLAADFDIGLVTVIGRLLEWWSWSLKAGFSYLFFTSMVYLTTVVPTRHQLRENQKQEYTFNPRTAGGLSHLRTAGGGGGTYVPPPANSKTTQRIDKREKALDRSEQALE